MKLFRRFKQIKKIKNMKFRGMGFLTVLEMFFSLLMIPCGLAFVSAMNPGATENALDVFGLMMAQYLLLALATFFRAVQRRYRHQIPLRRKVDFISSGVFLLCAVALKYPFEFITTQCVAGLIAIYTLRELSERSQIIQTAFLVTVAAAVFYLSLELINGKHVLGDNTLNTIDYVIYRHILVSGLLLLFAYPLMYALERVFGFLFFAEI